MKRMTEEQFDERLEGRVAKVAEAADRLMAEIARRPDLLTSGKIDKIGLFLVDKVESVTKFAEAEMRRGVIVKEEFKL